MTEIAAVIATALGGDFEVQRASLCRAHRGPDGPLPAVPAALSYRCLAAASARESGQRAAIVPVSWVDCTAAAHPLVLRPLIERLEARGTRSSSPRASTGRRWASSSGSACPTPWSASTGAPRRLGKVRALGGRSARLARVVWQRRPELAIGHGSVDLAVVSALFRVPSVQMQDYEFAQLQRQIAFRLARRVLVAGLDPARAAGEARRQGREAGPLSGPEGGVLPGRLRARPGGARTSSGSTARRCWSSCARRRRPPSTTPATTSTGRRSPPRRGARGAGRGHPPHRGAGGGGAGPRRRQPDRARAGDRRPEPDRLRRPRGQRGGDDEPRGGGTRHAGLLDLQRPHGRRRRGADRRRPPPGPRPTRRRWRCASAIRRSASAIRATRASWSRAPSAPSRSSSSLRVR